MGLAIEWGNGVGLARSMAAAIFFNMWREINNENFNCGTTLDICIRMAIHDTILWTVIL